MKKLIWFVGMCMIVACKEDAKSKIDASKQKKRTEVTIDQVDQDIDARMDFETLEWDFGTIEQGDVVEYSFQFTNSGSDPLIISSAKGSCGCTVPEWPREPIASGESATIDVKFNSKGKKGKQNKKVTLMTNMIPSQKVLTVKGQINLKAE